MSTLGLQQVVGSYSNKGAQTPNSKKLNQQLEFQNQSAFKLQKTVSTQKQHTHAHHQQSPQRKNTYLSSYRSKDNSIHSPNKSMNSLHKRTVNSSQPKKKGNQQIFDEQQQQIEELSAFKTDYWQLVDEVIDTYDSINQIIQYGDNEEIKKFHKDNYDIKFKERSPHELLKHIKSLFTVYQKNKEETHNLMEQAKIHISKDSGIQDYIYLLQKAEAENRSNIREKQQLKLSLEGYQEKLKNSEQQNELLAELSEKEMEELLKEYQKRLDDIRNNQDEIDELNKLIKKQKKANESLEERCLSIIILENKCKKLGIKFEEDVQRQKDEYKYKEVQLGIQTRETMRKDRSNLESSNQTLKNKIGQLEKINNRMSTENKNRVQQLEDIIEEREAHLARVVERYQESQSKLADRNQELYLIKNMKEDYGNPEQMNKPVMNRKP